jgi:hypothetical protein
MIRALTFAVLWASPALAQDAIRPQEQLRLDAYHDTAGRAILQAMSSGSRGDVDWLQEAMEGQPLSPLGTSLSGDWDCRTIKLGGDPALVVYAPFKCRFTPDGNSFVFEKLTGSQRTSGRITLQDRTMIYLGVGNVADLDPVAYGDLPPEDFGTGEIQPQVAIVEQTSPTTARMLFPAPINESLFDVLYLTRVLTPKE